MITRQADQVGKSLDTQVMKMQTSYKIRLLI